MISFIKFSSLIIILLFFPFSFYFNIIPVNSNSNNDSKIFDVYIGDVITDYEGWYTNVTIYSYYNVTRVIWEPGISEYTPPNIFYTNVTIEIGEKIKEPIILKQYYYFWDSYYLEDGENYSFILNINGIEYKKNFTYIKGPIRLDIDLGVWVEWNGEEWIARVELSSNSIPKNIDWGNVILENDEFYVNIIINEWIGEPVEYDVFTEEHNYSLGILPEGSYWFWAEANGAYGIGIPFEVAEVITTFTERWYSTTDIYTLTIETTVRVIQTVTTATFTHTNPAYPTLRTVLTYYTFLPSPIVTTTTEVVTEEYMAGIIETFYITIKVKEKTETTKISSITTKTIQVPTKEISKEEFKIEQYTIPIFLFIITIFVTIILYFILYRRRSI